MKALFKKFAIPCESCQQPDIVRQDCVFGRMLLKQSECKCMFFSGFFACLSANGERCCGAASQATPLQQKCGRRLQRTAEVSCLEGELPLCPPCAGIQAQALSRTTAKRVYHTLASCWLAGTRDRQDCCEVNRLQVAQARQPAPS